MEYKDIESSLNDENYLNEGKEVTVYKKNDQVVKIFHENRLSGLDQISEKGLEVLINLKLNCFNKPKEIIYNNSKVVGYTEDYIEDDFINKELLINSLDLLYEDIVTLSNNGFIINDIQYNYLSNGDTFKFIDMTSYNHFDVENIKSEIGKETILKKIFNDNINTINIFLIGLLEYDAYHKGMQYELTKTNKAVMFNQEKCQNLYYGEYLKGLQHKKKIK